MKGLLPIVRRIRRPLLPPDEPVAVEAKPQPAPVPPAAPVVPSEPLAPPTPPPAETDY